MTKVFITCALPYANGPCHLGHLRSTYIPADIYARYNRMKDVDVLFVCATDEHGTPIAVRAEETRKNPKEIVDRFHKMIKDDLDACNISFDYFSRTTDEVHYEIAQNFFLKLYENGYIYEKTIKQPYCEDCKRFLPDRYVEGTCPYCKGEGARGDHCESCGRHLDPIQLQEPNCLICSSTPKIKESTHYFFKLSMFEKSLKEWITDNNELPPNVKNYALGWIKEGLKDWILTRDMEWGIPVPLEDAQGKIIYVWGEAFLGYISSAAQWSNKNTPWEDYWNDKAIHFIGKDIIYHHAIFWPALLMAYGCKLPNNIIAGEYLSLEGQKMSTSKNWVIWASDFLEKFESDILRYYLIVNAPLSRDTDFSYDDFGRRVNDELADVLGNFLHRTFSFTASFFEGKVPEFSDGDELDQEFKERIIAIPDVVSAFIEDFKFREGLIEIIRTAKFANKYFNDKEPWKAVKENPQKAANCLHLCNQLARILAIILKPYIPVKAAQIGTIMNMENFEALKWKDTANLISAGHKINKTKPLFKKIDQDVLKKEKEELYKNLKEDETMKNIISIEDFAKIDLRIGEIIGAERVDGSDNLLKLKVDVKEKKLQIVAGLAKRYSSEEIKGQKVVVLVNLKPAKLFGIKSEGMILATSKNLSILTAQNALTGEKIK